MIKQKNIAGTLLLALMVMISPVGAMAQQADQLPISLSADEMEYDEQNATVTARGNVEISQSGRTLLADTITYDRNNDVVHADGNVVLHHPSGDVFFSSSAEVTGDLKNGVIEDIRAVLADRSRFAASRAELVDDKTMTLERSVYTRCEPCEEDPTRPPLWQLKAVKVVHNRQEKMVEYHSAWMEIGGIPVAYIPYLSYPDPTVKRKTGLLTPSFGSSSDFGTLAKVPYFFVIDDHRDVTLTPVLTTGGGNALAGQYRERMKNGEIEADASLAQSSGNGALGHIAATANFNIDRTWRWGVEANRAWGDTYMRRYGFSNQTTLTSRAYLEGFRGRNYASIETITFQGLSSSDKSATTPLIFPMAQFSHQGEPDAYGAYSTLDMNMTALTRSQGTDSRRVSADLGWTLPYIAPAGDVYKLRASLRTDLFHVNNQPHTGQANGLYSGAAYRIQPQLAMDWSWPLARRTGTVTEVLEPMAQVIVSPYGANSQKMANEDSIDFDFNETNLFSTNRYAGFDKIESGPRVNYGLKWGIYGDNGGSTNLRFGQSYRLKADDTFAKGSGLEDNFSDFVGMLTVRPNSNFDLLYRTRIDKNEVSFNSNEVGFNGKYDPVSFGANYVFFNSLSDTEFQGREEINYRLGYQVSENWNTRFNGIYDLTQDGGQRHAALGLIYDDECFTFDTTLSRSYYRDREIKPDDRIMFRLVFKTLGEVKTQQSLLGP